MIFLRSRRTKSCRFREVCRGRVGSARSIDLLRKGHGTDLGASTGAKNGEDGITAVSSVECIHVLLPMRSTWRCRVLLILAFALTPAFASTISVDEGKLEQIGLAMLNYESSFRHFCGIHQLGRDRAVELAGGYSSVPVPAGRGALQCIRFDQTLERPR